jgi:serine/threonine protein phosphatase 1
MRYLAIGDIHGHAEVLQQLLEAVQPGADDQIITLGDYVDRGREARQVLDMLIALNRTGRLVALRGNHDFLMLNARQGGPPYYEWLVCGGQPTLDSYGTDLIEGKLEDVPEAHWDFLEKTCIDWYEIDTHFFVHANVDPNNELEDQPLYQLHWEPLHEDRVHCSGKIMVCGHTKQKSGKPKNWGHAICIDTWVYGEGWLTCMDVKTGQLWQANRHGELRTDWLEEPEPM